jgi:hypothetical protein
MATKKKPSRASRELMRITKEAHKRLDARDATKKRGK